MAGGLVSHVLNRSVADLALLREAGGLRGLRADSDVHRQKPRLRERPVAKPAGRRSGIVAYPTARRSPVEADGESEKRAASPFPCPAPRTLDDHGGAGGLAVEEVAGVSRQKADRAILGHHLSIRSHTTSSRNDGGNGAAAEKL
jgi:hypothetical protein